MRSASLDFWISGFPFKAFIHVVRLVCHFNAKQSRSGPLINTYLVAAMDIDRCLREKQVPKGCDKRVRIVCGRTSELVTRCPVSRLPNQANPQQNPQPRQQNFTFRNGATSQHATLLNFRPFKLENFPSNCQLSSQEHQQTPGHR